MNTKGMKRMKSTKKEGTKIKKNSKEFSFQGKGRTTRTL